MFSLKPNKDDEVSLSSSESEANSDIEKNIAE